MYGVGEEPIVYFTHNELFVKMEKITNWRLFIWGLSFTFKLHQNYPLKAGLNVNYGEKLLISKLESLIGVKISTLGHSIRTS